MMPCRYEFPNPCSRLPTTGELVMRFAAGITMICALGVLAGCSGGGGISSIITPPPVNAQTTYSNASLNGTYSINLAGINGKGENVSSFIGFFKADGAGNLSAGTLTQYGIGSDITGSCALTFTGTYSLQSTAVGTATITVSSSGTNGCTLSGPIQFATQAGLQGQSLHFVESDSIGLVSGTATKQ
jgi:hypothetical protein